MKRIARAFTVEFFGLYVASRVASGLVFQNELEGMVITAMGLAVASMLVRPVINFLILPLTLATMGLLKFLGHAIMLYLVDLALVQFAVEQFDFPGLVSPYLDLPPVHYPAGPFAYVAFSLVISVVTGLVHWLMK